jgi:maleylacetoacetate isomerase
VKLYSYHRSSAAYRVRIALNLKGLAYQYAPVNLLQQEQKSDAYLQRNPQGLLPALETDDGHILAQSVAILEWLEDIHPEPALLPTDPLKRAQVRSLVNSIACDVHPLNNLSILNYLRDELEADKQKVSQWYTTWVHRGFDAIEQSLAAANEPFCLGKTPSMADVCLVPQVYNAKRFKVPLENHPNILRVCDHCNTLEAFTTAAPEAQPDAP